MTESETALAAVQRERAEALREARSTLRSSGGPLSAGSLSGFTVFDVITVADYIVTGARPWDDDPGDES